MTDAIWELVLPDDGPPRRMVGIMGGHACRRDDPAYWRVVELAIALTEAGFTVATGGGPGIMEAGQPRRIPDAAGDRGAIAARPGASSRRHRPSTTPNTAPRAEAVHASRRGPDGSAGGISLAIPTWLYDHEPVGRFAIAHRQVLRQLDSRGRPAPRGAAPASSSRRGGAGTVQEVFQDLAVNAYAEPGERAPMVFLGRELLHRQRRPRGRRADGRGGRARRSPT